MNWVKDLLVLFSVFLGTRAEFPRRDPEARTGRVEPLHVAGSDMVRRMEAYH
jgi:hypothetical protein